MERTPGRFLRWQALGFALVISVLTGTAVIANQRLGVAVDEHQSTVESYVEGVIGTERLDSATKQMTADGRSYLVDGGADLLKRFRADEVDVIATLQQLERARWSPDGRELLRAVDRDTHAYVDAVSKAVAATRRPRDLDERRRLLDETVRPQRRVLDAAVTALVAHKEEGLHAAYARAHRATKGTVALSLGVLLLATAASFLLAMTITERLTRMFDAEQRAVRAAERAKAARDEVLGVVAHDLRTPLASIALSAQVMMSRASDPPRARAAGERVLRGAEKMEQLIRSLLDLATLDAGRMSLSPVRCDIARLLGETIEMLAPSASARQITVTLRVPERLSVTVDRSRMSQVLANLVGNAIKFTPENGRVEVSAERSGDIVVLTVADTGPGIARENLEHIFDRFWKSGARQGTGLGLFIARGIVEAHGGRIWAESEPGQGARLRVEIPAALELDEAPALAPEPQSA